MNHRQRIVITIKRIPGPKILVIIGAGVLALSSPLTTDVLAQRNQQEEEQNELHEFGGELKNAIREGTIGEADAMRLYTLVAEISGLGGGQGGADDPKSDAFLEQVDAKLQAMVQAGNLSQADADAKMEAVRNDAIDKRQGSGKQGLSGGLDRQPYYRTDDLEILERILQLDTDQALMAEALLAGFQAGHTGWYADASAALRTEQSALRDQLKRQRGDIGTWQRTAARFTNLIAEFNREKDANELNLVDSARDLLTNEQRSRWHIVEREIRRARTMSYGKFSGERTDLYEIATKSDLAFEHSDRLTHLLEQYAATLDPALMARNDFLEQRMGAIGDLIQEMAVERVLSLAQREARLRTGVRDINEQWAQAIANDLGGEAGQRFRTEYR